RRNTLTQVHLAEEKDAERALGCETLRIGPPKLCCRCRRLETERYDPDLLGRNSLFLEKPPRPRRVDDDEVRQAGFLTPGIPIARAHRPPVGDKRGSLRAQPRNDPLLARPGIDLAEHRPPSSRACEPKWRQRRVAIGEERQLATDSGEPCAGLHR